MRSRGAAPQSPTAVVVGGGVSGLVAARELAMAGIAVTVLEASESWGGCVGSHVVAGLSLDSGAESFATRSSAVADLVRELGIGGQIVAPRPGGAWVQLPEGARELPKTGILGIPANPWDPEVRRSLGFLGALRASMDRILPAGLGTSAELTSVSQLVRTRMGKRVLERLVEPVVGGVHSADPALLDVDMVAPGLRDGVRANGSLAAAVAAQRKAARGAGSAPAKAGSAVAGLKGGMHTLVGALVKDLQDRGVVLLTHQRVDGIRKAGTGWQVSAGDSTYDAGRLVVALDGPAAVGLLADSVPALAGLRPEAGPLVSLVTLVVDLPELDSRPRGTGILVAPQTPGVRAKALTHATSKWDWLAGEAGPGTHVVRLSYGRLVGVDGSDGQSASVMDDQSLLSAAVEDASNLLTVPITRADVVDWDVVRWEGALPFAAVGHKQRVAEVRRVCGAVEGLAVVGGWLAGNGLAAVVADTRTQAKKLAHDAASM
ncbi:protoporphyrinogen oxidase [Paenarthrobacter ureafaciens]|uniref:protoporphyrinogen oxidase n=1 Tax=Paenarthrobacter ureafaciens TaxID=37931 RepID=UPI00226477FE|nr:protoporphyrinogen oxidase [Paenarthrobacter ureafaciens]MCX8453423.1 protoporphyrinogen oxidase [Paenarthrobacter ureafaciens]MCY0973004.1 protoporphyrinogen oxidase [Paenarthrobacter ureafaciens]